MYSKGSVGQGSTKGADSRPLLVFLSGAESIKVAEEFQRHFGLLGYEVVPIEFPGFGETAGDMPELDLQTALSRIKEQLFSAAEGREVMLVAHSMGALAAVLLGVDEEVSRRVKLRGVIQLAPAYLLKDIPSRLIGEAIVFLTSRPFRPLLPLLRLFRRPVKSFLELCFMLRYGSKWVPIRSMYAKLAEKPGAAMESGELSRGVLMPETLCLNGTSLYFEFAFEALAALWRLEVPVTEIFADGDCFVVSISGRVSGRSKWCCRKVVPGGGHFFPLYSLMLTECAIDELLTAFCGNAS